MYCNIYQISDSPIESGDYINVCDFEDHWFINNIAEFVTEIRNPDDGYRELREMLEQNMVAAFNDNGSFTILPYGKENYFKDAFDRFCKAFQKIEGKTLSDFASSCKFSNWVEQLCVSRCDKYGAYVSLDDLEIIPFDEFIRKADRRRRYFIGAVLQYKY